MSKTMLQNHTYAGTRYYNSMTAVPTVKSDGTTAKRGKYVPRDRSEWIPVKVPAIVSQELFDKVQDRIRQGNDRYCHPHAHHVLRGLIECGECGSAFYSYRRYYTKERLVQGRRVYHKAAYECRGRARENTHCRDRIERRYNSEIATHLLEEKGRRIDP